MTSATRAARPLHDRPLPKTTRGEVPRQRLLDRLDTLAAVTAVIALPGSGKTALVAEWASRRSEGGDVVIWISGDKIGDPADLHAHLHDAIATPDHHTDCETRDASGPPVVVVIDRADVVVDPDVVTSLCAMIADTPRLHVVICARSWHPLVPAARSFGVSVNLLTDHDLLATSDELALFAHAWGHAVRTDVADVHAYSRGWILPARLCLDGHPDGSDVTGNVVAIDYIRTTVLDALADPDVLVAAMRLALPDRITAVHVAEVAAAWPSGDGLRTEHDLVAWLRRAGLMGPDGDGGPGAIPPMLRDALVVEYAARSPADVTAWHGRFSRALRDASDTAYIGLVVRHASAAGDWLLLTEIWTAASLLLVTQHADDVVAAYGRVKESVLAARSALRMPHAVARVLAEHPPVASIERALAQAVRAVGGSRRTGDGATDDHQENNVNMQLLGATVVADRGEGRYERALTAASRLNQELVGRKRHSTGSTPGLERAWALHQWARTWLLAGNAQKALALAVRAFAAADQLTRSPVAAHIAADIALIHAIRGSTRSADHWLDIHARRAVDGQWMDEMIALPARIAGMLVALDRLDREAAEAYLPYIDGDADQSELWPFVVQALTQYAVTYGDPALALAAVDRYAVLNPSSTVSDGAPARILSRCSADLNLAMGEANRARRLIRDAGIDTPWLQSPWARLHLITGDHAQALRIAAANSWASVTPRDQLDFLMTKAAAAYALGDIELAGQAFARVTSLAPRLGTVRPYLQIDADIRNALLDQTGTVLDQDVRAGLDTTRQTYPSRAELVTLTDRELAVLYELTRHASWSDIADVLVVAPTTVKKQILSLYTKLDAHDRDAAVLRATRLAFLPEPRDRSVDDTRGPLRDLTAEPDASTTRADGMTKRPV